LKRITHNTVFADKYEAGRGNAVNAEIAVNAWNGSYVTGVDATLPALKRFHGGIAQLVER
jgi:hypothetical protein